MTELLEYAIRGVPFGCVFALVGTGLVLAFRTSGVFNLGLAAQSFLSAAVFYDLRVRHELPLVAAFVLAAFVVSPIVGLVLERTVFRWLRTSPPMARLVATTGVVVALPAAVKLLYGARPTYAPPVLWPDEAALVHLGRFTLDAKDLSVVVATAALVLLLALLLVGTPFGLVSRAVVESPRLAGLTGTDADAVGAASWVISSAFAGVAGVLISPLFAQVLDRYFFNVLVAAIAVAAFGRLRNLPLTLLGGLLLGIAQGVLAGYLPAGSVLAKGLRPSLPFAALFLVLLVSRAVHEKETPDPLAGVDPPPELLFADDDPCPPTTSGRLLTIALVAAGLVAIGLHYPEAIWLPWAIEACVFTVIFLSVTVFTGLGGQLSLCQATFAAIGAFTTAQLATSAGVPVLLAAVIGAALAAAVGAALALSTIRLSGVYLALATLAFAFMFQSAVQPLSWVTGGRSVPQHVPRPVLGPVDFASDRVFFVLVLAIAALVAGLVAAVRRGGTGLMLQAVRGSEVAAQALGIDVRAARVLSFGLAAALAGLGGGLLSMYRVAARPQDFDPLVGLLWVAGVVTLGARTLEGAINAAVGINAFGIIVCHDLLPWILDTVQPWHDVDELSLQWVTVLFGLGAITYARNPDGIIAATRRAATRRRRRRRRFVARTELVGSLA